MIAVAVFAAGLVAPVAEPAVRREPAAGIELVRIPAGEFWMGSPEDERGREPGERRHRVRITRAFDLGRTEVTQDQWSKLMGTRPSHFRDCGSCPVEEVNWHEARQFLKRLSELSGAVFRLPTEAEWEYACRAGTATPFSTGENLTTSQANYDGRYPYDGFAPGLFRHRTTPAGTFPPNPWGLLDMHGNVWEWCEDDFCPYGGGAAVDPIGACGSPRKVIRGGSWYFNADSARSALRYTHRPADRGFSLGFRVVRELPAAEAGLSR